MGDRAYTQFEIPVPIVEQRRSVLLAILSPDAETIEDGAVEFTIEQSDGGGHREADELRRLAIPFLVRWDHGGEYGPGATIFVPGHGDVSVDCCGFAEGPAVSVLLDGRPDPAQLQNAREFLDVLRRFRAECGSASST